MKTRPANSAADAVRDQREPLSVACRRALLWALVASMVGCVLLGILLGLYALSGGPIELGPALRGIAVVFVLLFGVLFLARLLWQSRTLMDASFFWMGLVATFFGLIMLLVFFAQLTISAVQWFRYTPDLVRCENEQLKARSELSDKQRREAALKDINDEIKIFLDAATTEEEKKQIRDSYKPVIEERLKALQREAQEATIFAKHGIRPDVSRPALVGHYFTHNDSPMDSPQDAGIYAALFGSLWVAILAILTAVPLGVGAAVYLEEYKHSGWLGRLIQVNINNLAGVPSVVYGILGGYIFVDRIFRPLAHRQELLENELVVGGGFLDQLVALLPHLSYRNTLGGGLTLGLLTLPMVIVAAQEAIRAIPISIRHGAHALGATRWQVIRHNVLPLARPGILTGTILALSRAIGEAAPLVLFGALLSVDQAPGFFTRFTVVPMQIFSWSDRAPVLVDGEAVPMWQYNAGVASLLLMFALVAMNGLAIYLRSRAQRRVRW